MSKHAVVVHDPEGRELDGEVLSGNAIAVAKARGVVLLPVELDLLRRGGASGWVKRSYGRGWNYDRVIAARGCPLVMHADPAFPLIVWVARLQADEPSIEGSVTGSLRLAADTGQAGAHSAGMSPLNPPIQLHALGPADAAGGWYIEGGSRVGLGADQMLGLQLYGQIGGARVRWLAASQTR